MSLVFAFGLIAFLGAFGGILHCFLFDGFKSWRYDDETKVFQPGWIGTVIVGAGAAIVVFALYGPWATKVLTFDLKSDIPVAQIAGSIIVGISGSQILTALAQKKADDIAKKDLSEALTKLLKKVQ
jgi:hypothetical protein